MYELHGITTHMASDGGHTNSDTAFALDAEFQIFASISPIMYDTFIREVISLKSYNDVSYGPTMGWYVVVSVSKWGDLLRAS